MKHTDTVSTQWLDQSFNSLDRADLIDTDTFTTNNELTVGLQATWLCAVLSCCATQTLANRVQTNRAQSKESASKIKSESGTINHTHRGRQWVVWALHHTQATTLADHKSRRTMTGGKYCGTVSMTRDHKSTSHHTIIIES